MKVLLASVLVVSAVAVPGQAVASGIDKPLTVAGQAAAMQKDFGLTEQQMNARLKSETDAAKLLPAAQKAAGAEFGGAWYDAATQKLVVGLAGSSRANAVRATGVATVAVPKPAAVLDKQKAAVLYGRACESGNPVACYNLANLRFAEGGGRQVVASELYRRACRDGLAAACRSAGYQAERGLGITADPSTAALLYSEACIIGDGRGCYYLALMLMEGRGVQRDEEQAQAILWRSCRAGVTAACDELQKRGASPRAGSIEPHPVDL